MRILPGPTRSNSVLVWSTDGQFIAAGGSGDGVMVWDLNAGLPGQRLINSAHGGHHLRFCSLTGRLYVAFQTGGFWHWDPVTDKNRKYGWSAGYTWLGGLAVSNDGRMIAVRGRNGTCHIIGYAVTDGGELSEEWRLSGNPDIETFTFRPGTSELFGLGRPTYGASRFEWLQSGTGMTVGSFLVPPENGRVTKWALAPNGEQVVWLTNRGLFLRRLDDSVTQELPTADGEVRRGVAFHPNGQMLAYTTGNTVRLLDANTLSEIRTLDWNIGKTRAVSFSPDGLRCAVSGEGGRGWVTVFDLE